MANKHDDALHQGYMYKLGEKGLIKSFKRRWFVLDRSTKKLYYYKSKERFHSLTTSKAPDPSYLQLAGHIDLSLADGVRFTGYSSSKRFGFVVMIPGRKYRLETTDKADAEEWIRIIEDVRSGTVNSMDSLSSFEHRTDGASVMSVPASSAVVASREAVDVAADKNGKEESRTDGGIAEHDVHDINDSNETNFEQFQNDSSLTVNLNLNENGNENERDEGEGIDAPEISTFDTHQHMDSVPLQATQKKQKKGIGNILSRPPLGQSVSDSKISNHSVADKTANKRVADREVFRRARSGTLQELDDLMDEVKERQREASTGFSTSLVDSIPAEIEGEKDAADNSDNFAAVSLDDNDNDNNEGNVTIPTVSISVEGDGGSTSISISTVPAQAALHVPTIETDNDNVIDMDTNTNMNMDMDDNVDGNDGFAEVSLDIDGTDSDATLGKSRLLRALSFAAGRVASPAGRHHSPSAAAATPSRGSAASTGHNTNTALLKTSDDGLRSQSVNVHIRPHSHSHIPGEDGDGDSSASADQVVRRTSLDLKLNARSGIGGITSAAHTLSGGLGTGAPIGKDGIDKGNSKAKARTGPPIEPADAGFEAVCLMAEDEDVDDLNINGTDMASMDFASAPIDTFDSNASASISASSVSPNVNVRVKSRSQSDYLGRTRTHTHTGYGHVPTLEFRHSMAVAPEVTPADEGLLTDMGDMHMEGFLMKKSSNVLEKWQRRYFALTQNALQYYHAYPASGSRARPAGSLPLKSILTVRPMSDNQSERSAHRNPHHQNIFEVVMPSRVYKLQASAKDIMEKWIESIRVAQHICVHGPAEPPPGPEPQQQQHPQQRSPAPARSPSRSVSFQDHKAQITSESTAKIDINTDMDIDMMSDDIDINMDESRLAKLEKAVEEEAQAGGLNLMI